MKPQAPFFSEKRRLPLTDHCFHAGLRGWGSSFSSRDDDNRHHLRTFHRLSRDLLLESARERFWEAVVFGFVVVAAAWPVVYTVVVVVKLLLHGRPLT